MRNLSGVLSLVLISLVLLSCGGNSAPSISLIPVQNGKDFQYIDKEGKIIAKNLRGPALEEKLQELLGP